MGNDPNDTVLDGRSDHYLGATLGGQGPHGGNRT